MSPLFSDVIQFRKNGFGLPDPGSVQDLHKLAQKEFRNVCHICLCIRVPVYRTNNYTVLDNFFAAWSVEFERYTGLPLDTHITISKVDPVFGRLRYHSLILTQDLQIGLGRRPPNSKEQKKGQGSRGWVPCAGGCRRTNRNRLLHEYDLVLYNGLAVVLVCRQLCNPIVLLL